MKNYFDFYNLPISFFLDENTLKKQFLRYSKKYHPDFYTLEKPEKQLEILELSTLNNEAYQTLANFDARLAYILRLKNVLTAETKGNETLPQDFLLDMMDLNEQLMELEFEFDKKIYEKVLSSVNAFNAKFYEEIKPFLVEYSEDTPPQYQEEILKKVKNFYLKMRYLLRIREKLFIFAPQFERGV